MFHADKIIREVQLDMTELIVAYLKKILSLNQRLIRILKSLIHTPSKQGSIAKFKKQINS